MITVPANGLLIPDLPQLLNRQRLTESLRERDYKLVMLVAPLGFGKTSLAREYAAWLSHSNNNGLEEAYQNSTQLKIQNSKFKIQNSPGFAWLSLDVRHIKWDVRLFLQILIKALKNSNAAPELELGQLEHTLAELSPNIEITPETLANLIYLLSDSLAEYGRPLLLVMDDFHAVSEDRLIIEAVNQLLLTSPANLRVIITSRLFPGLDVLKLTMEDQFLLINKGQLRFTREEIGQLLALRGKDPAMAERVEHRSEGWAALVTLSLRVLDKDPNVAFVKGTGPLNALFGTLIEETLRNLDKELRSFLENCSILEVGIDVGAAGALLDKANGEKLAAAYFSRLEKQGLVESHKSLTGGNAEGSKTIFRLHSLLKEHLEAGLEQERMVWLHRRAANYYQGRGDWLPAFEHFLKATDQAQAAALLEGVVSENFKTNNVTEIAQCIERLDESVLSNHPHLLLVAGMTKHMAGRFDKAISYFFAANRLWGAYPALDRLVAEETENLALPQTEPTLGLNVLVNKAETISRIALIWTGTGKLPQAMTTLQGIVQFLSGLKGGQDDTRWLHTLAQARRTLGVCYLQDGQINECIEQCSKALNAFISLGDEYNAAGCRHNLGVAWRKLGNQAQAEREFLNALEYWKRVGSVQLPNTLNSLAVGLINEGRYKEAIPLFTEAQTKAKEGNYEKLSHFLLSGLGDAYTGLRDWKRALSYYGQAGAEADKQNHLQMLTYAQLGIARVYRRSGDSSQTWKALLKALSYAESSNRDAERAAVAVELGAYQVMMSQLEQAPGQLDGALTLARKVRDLEIEAAAYFWTAYMQLRQNRQRQAQESMRRALALAQELGYNSFLVEEANELPEMSAFFRGHSSDQTVAFFAKGGEEIMPPPPIQLLAFGKGQILFDGSEVRMTSKKARELIFFLLEEKAPVSGERISETLWPDADLAGGGLGSGFYSTITHARKALGGADTVRAAGGSYSLNVRYRYDVDEFDQKLNRAERQFDPLVRIDLLNSALEFYTEDFLTGADMDWVQMRREVLRQKWLRALRLLGEAYTAANRREEALDTWFKAMNAEPFDEQPLRAYTILLSESKSKTIAVNFLRRKIDALHNDGIQPEDTTMQLLEQLDASRTISKRRA